MQYTQLSDYNLILELALSARPLLATVMHTIVVLATIKYATKPIVTALVIIEYAATGLGSKRFGQYFKTLTSNLEVVCTLQLILPPTITLA